MNVLYLIDLPFTLFSLYAL